MIPDQRRAQELSKKREWLSWIFGACGLLALLFGGISQRAAALQSYWSAWVFWASLTCGALALWMLQNLAAGAWTEPIRRRTVAAAMNLPVVAVLLVPALFQLEEIFPWARHSTSTQLGPHQRLYLTPSGFTWRAILIFALFFGLARALERGSRASRKKWSAGGLIMFGAAIYFAATDWVMSLVPGWISSIFPMIFMVSGFLAALALVVALAAREASQNAASAHMPKATDAKAFHDLGNLLLAFVVFWGYVSFSQFLIIWAGNLPREIAWYLPRRQGHWPRFAAMLAVCQLGVPFALLLSRRAKRNPRRLGPIAWFVCITSYLQSYWLVAPSFHSDSIVGSWRDLAALFGVGGIWWGAFLRSLNTERAGKSGARQPEFLHA